MEGIEACAVSAHQLPEHLDERGIIHRLDHVGIEACLLRLLAVFFLAPASQGSEINIVPARQGAQTRADPARMRRPRIP